MARFEQQGVVLGHVDIVDRALAVVICGKMEETLTVGDRAARFQCSMHEDDLMGRPRRNGAMSRVRLCRGPEGHVANLRPIEAKAVISPLRSNLAAYRDRDLRHGVVPVEAVPQAMRDAFREYL